MFDRLAASLARFVSARPWTVLVAVVLAAGLLAAQGMPAMSNDSSAFAPDSPAVAAADRTSELFGSDDDVTPFQVIVSSETSNVISLDGLEAVAAVNAAIDAAAVDGVALRDLLVAEAGSEPVVSFLSPVEQAIALGAPAPTTDADVEALFATSVDSAPAEALGFIEGLFPVGTDLGSATTDAGLVFARVEAPADNPGIVTALEQQVAASLEGRSFGDATTAPFSFGLIAAASDGSASEIPILLGIAVLIIGLVLAVVYFPGRGTTFLARSRRSLADTGLTLAVALLAVSVSNGAAVLLGPDGLGIMGALSGPSQIVPILLIGLGVDYVIHLNAAYRSAIADGAAVEEATRRSTKIVGGALFLSAATTVVGFLTNLWSGIPALYDFGLLASIGITAALLLALTLFPAVRALLDRRAERIGRLATESLDPRGRGFVDRAVSRTEVIPRRAPWTAIGVFGVVLIAGAVAATNLQSGFSFLDFVPADAPVRATAVQLTEEFSGGLGETTSVLVEGDLTPGAMTAIDDSIDTALALDGVVAGSGVQTEQADGAMLVTFTTQSGTEGALALADDLENAFAPVAAGGASVVATSPEIVDAAVVTAISDIQVQSLLAALAAAAIILMISFWRSDRSPIVGLLTALPVGLVVVLLFGFMALVGIPFGPVTATLAAVVIGVGVDYTIHVAHRFADFRREGLPIDDAMAATLSTTGSALVTSALTTAAGFAILMASSLIPFRQFGVLTLVAVVGSALVSVLLLPSVLTVWARATDRGIAPVPQRIRELTTSDA